jgi:hypothetical protein
LPLIPEVGAVCGKAARTDLGGGREVTRVPTAKAFFAALHESGFVQVFGRRQRRAIHALRRPAFEKRQGTKSREIRSVGLCRGLSYGDLSGEHASCTPAQGERWSDWAGRSMPARLR